MTYEYLREPVSRDNLDSIKPGEVIKKFDLANVELRRGNRKKKPSPLLQENNELGKSKEIATMNKVYGLMVMVNDMKSSMDDIKANVYTAFLDGYDNYFDLNFDRTRNSMSTLGNI